MHVDQQKVRIRRTMKNIPLLLSHTSELFSLWYRKEHHAKAADKIKRQYFFERKYLGSKDRRFIDDLFFNMVKNLRLYTWQLTGEDNALGDKLSPELLTVHAFKRTFPDHGDTVVFKIEDNISKFFQEHEYKDVYPNELKIKYSVPDVLWDHIKDAYSEQEVEEALQSLLRSPGVHLRTNTQQINTPRLMENLSNVPFRLGALSPEALRLEKYQNLSQHPCYKKGWFELQDESSQLVGLVCNPKAEDLVVDLCAGAGGKTMHLAALQKDSGNLVATDKYPSRLKELVIRAKRLGFRHIKLIPIEKIKRIYKEKVDILLLDAPCSGTGVYGRHPDRKWELNEERLQNYINEQANILESNAFLVSKGGYLVYATCSIIPEENTLQIQNFLSKHPEFEMVSVYKDLEDHGIRIKGKQEKKDLQLLPHEYNSDGFYIAKMRRKS